MSTKMFYLFFVIIISLLSSCGGGRRSCLGRDYHKMSYLELEEGGHSEYAYKRALHYIDRALEQDDKGLYAAYRGTVLFLLGKSGESFAAFKQALSAPLPPRVRAEVLNNYACLLASKKLWREALSIFASLESDPCYLTPEVVLVNQAKIFYEARLFEKARVKLLDAVCRAPLYIDAHYYLGLVHYALGDYDDALKAAKKVMSLTDSHAGASMLFNLCKSSIY